MTRLDRGTCKECGAMSYMVFDDQGKAKKWVCVTGKHEYKPVGREFKIKAGDMIVDESDLVAGYLKSRVMYG